MGSSLPTIDLFAGAGGSALGSAVAGHDVRLAVEFDADACETLRANHSFHGADVIEADITELSGKSLRHQAGLKSRDPLVIVGGPPCQPFSKQSYWTDSGAESRFRRARDRGEEQLPERPKPVTTARKDSRRNLLFDFLRIAVESKADALVFENVPSIVHPRNKPTFERFVKACETEGYKTKFQILNAAEFGVPQNRKRMILLATKGNSPKLPSPTHRNIDDTLEFGLKPTPCVGEAIAQFASEDFFEEEEVVTGRWEKELKEIPPGMNYKALTKWAGHPNPTFVAESRFWNFLLKLAPNKLSWTIAAGPGPWVGPFHWDSRRLRTPELAAVQGFPDGYTFKGSRRERVRQIGNAMPPPLAAAAARQVAGALGFVDVEYASA